MELFLSVNRNLKYPHIRGIASIEDVFSSVCYCAVYCPLKLNASNCTVVLVCYSYHYCQLLLE